MTSKISYFKIAIEDLRHRTWMLALSCLGSLLALPVFFLLANRAYWNDYQRVLKYHPGKTDAALSLLGKYINHMNTYSAITCGIVLILGALIVGICGFRYLYSKKMVDLYHSMPIKRSRLFFIKHLNGLLIWLLPMVLSLLVTLLLMSFNLVKVGYAAGIGSLLPAYGKLLLFCLLSFLTVYHFCLVCVMLCGNAFNAICSTILGGCSIAALWALNIIYSEAYLKTFVTSSLDMEKVFWLSPLVNAVYMLTYPALDSNITSVPGEVTYWILSLLMIVVLLVAAYLLYRKRPSELAEHGIESKPVQHFLRVLLSLIAGVTFALIFIAILDAEATGWILFGSILGAFLAFGVLNIIFHMDFRAFFRHKWEMLLTIVIACLIFPVYKFDLTGYDKRLPKQENIAEVEYYIYEFCEQGFNHSTVSYEDTSALYQLLQAVTDERHLENEMEESGHISLSITLTNGRQFHRSYDYLESDLELLRPIIEDENYINAYYPCSTGQLGIPDRMELTTEANSIVYNDLNESQRQTIMEAYYQDFAQHSTMEELACGVSVCEISAYYNDVDYDLSRSYLLNRCELRVYDTYTATIAAIEECIPGCNLIPDAEDIYYLEILPDVDISLPKDCLYSYFGLEGYPDYDTYEGEYQQTESALPEADVISTEAYTSQIVATERVKQYVLNVEDTDEIASLLPLLHIGYRRYCSLDSLQEGYVYLGQVHLTNGNMVTCYVKAGELPKEWIDKISLVESP